MDERRNFARVDHQLLVEYSHRDASNAMDEEGMAKTLDMSVKGLLLVLPRSVEIGAVLNLALDLEGEVVEVVGRVVRCTPAPDNSELFDAGIELAHVPEHYRQAVERYFARTPVVG
jgi:hypothetical protein